MRDAASSIEDFYNKFYDTNGYSISARGGQVFIEVAFKEAVDYNNGTGLMDINDNIFFLNYPDYIKEMANGAVIWEVTEVNSVFSSGSFTQTLSLIGTAFDAGGSPTPGSQTSTPAGSNASSDPDDLQTEGNFDSLQGIDGRPLDEEGGRG